MRKRVAISFVTAALWSGQSPAQAPTPITNTELSKDTENPVARQITLPLRYEADLDDGAYEATKNTFEIDQAVLPFRLNEDWALITRTKLPLELLPPKKLGEHWTFGLSNGYTTFFLSPENGQGFYWGAGPVLYYPTATNPALGVNKWGSGPSAAFLHQDTSPWVFGAVVNNIWSFGGPTTGSDRTNQLFLNPIVNYHFGDGWSVGSSPEITTNWIASGGKWTVPVGGGFGKLFRVDGQAVRVDLDSYYNAVRPEAGNDTWLVQLKLTFVFPDRSPVNFKRSDQ
jgi:hypothetical protein